MRLARASPGKLNYASAGVGTTFHLCAEMFKDATGTFILHVPYRGGGPALLDTLAGQVDLSFPTLSAALPHVKAGTLRALARDRARRARRCCPRCRRCARPGVKNFQFTQWLALLAPAGTPRDDRRAPERRAAAALQIARKCARNSTQQGFDAYVTTPEEAGKFLASEVERFAQGHQGTQITAE